MKRRAIGVLTTVLALGTLACNVDAPSAPARSDGGPALSAATMRVARPLSGIGGAATAATTALDTVFVLRRTAALRADVSKSAEIGPAGGEIRIGEAGARIIFPPGALDVATTITMTARAGWDVAYEFAPHGIRFAQPVRIEQDLHGTLAARFPALLQGLQGSYYDKPLDESFIDPWHLYATIRENLPGKSDRRTMELTFQIHHFSGYLVSSGRSGPR